MIKTIHKAFRINGLKLFKVKTDSEKEYRCSDCLDLPDVEKIFVEYTIDTPSDDLCELGHILSANVFFQTSNRAAKNLRGNYQLKARVKSNVGDIHFVLYKLKLTADKYFPYYEVGGTGDYTKHVFDKSTKRKVERMRKPIEQRINNYFDRGNGDWDKLYDFMDKESFTRLDFLACVCASLLREPDTEFETELGIGGIKFGINIRKK